MTETGNSVQTNEDLKICNHCGAKIMDDAQFCSACGRPIRIAITKKFCAICGTGLSDEEMFCHNCGFPTSQNRDAEVINNIATYNSSLSKSKKSICDVNIKDNSIWSFIAWILTALFTALLSTGLTTQIAYMNNFSEMLTVEKLLFVFSLICFATSTVSGLLFWKNDKKLRLMPIIASLIATLCCLISEWGFTVKIELIVSALLMHIIAILFAVRVIKTKTVLLITSILATSLSLIIPIMSGFSDVMPFVLQIPIFLLVFSFTEKEIKEVPKKKLFLRKIISLCLALFLLLGGISLGLYNSWVYVGDITNMSVEKAKDKYNRLNIQPLYNYSENIIKGCVIWQNIKKGSFVHPNSKITLIISKGPGVKIPNIINTDIEEAEKDLLKLGLKVEINYNYSNSISKNKVIKVLKYHVDEGGTVILIVSKGPDKRIKVPNVKNLTESEARYKLKKAGFHVKTKYVYENCDASKNKSSVLSQSLNGKHNPGSTVTLRVTKPSVLIQRIDFEHNSVGGVDIEINFKNASNKTIKYIYFNTRFKNAVGDDTYCEIKNKCTARLMYTGPLYSGSSQTTYWDAITYDWLCKQIHFDEIEVIFMDGTTHSMEYNSYWH